MFILNGMRLTNAMMKRDGTEVCPSGSFWSATTASPTRDDHLSRPAWRGNRLQRYVLGHARGISDDMLIKSANRSTLDELAD